MACRSDDALPATEAAATAPAIPVGMVLPHIVPRTIAGTSGGGSVASSALDWGWQGLVAYGCGLLVVVVDPVTLQLVQTLEKHRSPITAVKWQRSLSDARFAYRPTLATADSSGQVVIWDVKEGIFTSVLQDAAVCVSQLSWLSEVEGCGHLLLVSQQSSLILWDTDSGDMVWKKSLTGSIVGFDLDPFDSNRLAVLCPSYILFIDDFSTSKCPSGGGSKFYVSSIRDKVGSPTTPSGGGTAARNRLRRVLHLVTGDIPGPDDSGTNKGGGDGSSSECRLLMYLRSCRHQLLLVLARELLVIDLQSMSTLSTAASGLVSVLPFARCDALLCLTDNCVLSVRARGSTDLLEVCALTDAPRLTRQQRAVVAGFDPVSESRFTALLSDGRLLFWDLFPTAGDSALLLPLNVSLSPSRREKLILTGLLSVGPVAPGVVRMCPPLTTSNWRHYTPRVVCGTVAGSLIVLNLAQGCVEKEFSIHSYTVRGVEWTGHDSVLSYATIRTPSLCNEMMHTELSTGVSVSLRRDMTENDRQPIVSIRVSHLRQYAIAVFASGQPLEIWSLTTLQPLRTLPDQFPSVTALEWAPTHSSVRRHHSSASSTASDEKDSSAPAKEHFVFTVASGHVCHFTVEGVQVRDGARIPLNVTMLRGRVTALAWKANSLSLGDSEGQLCIWDLNTRRSRLLAAETGHRHFGAVTRMRFAPGRGNSKLLVLLADGSVEVWDVGASVSGDRRRISQLRWPRDTSVRTRDADWATSDKPVLLGDDGCVRVVDLQLRVGCSATDVYQYRHPVVYPCLMALGAVSRLEKRLFIGAGADAAESSPDDVAVDSFMATLPSHLKVWLRDPEARSRSDLALTISLLLGNENAVRLWRLVAHYLHQQSTGDTDSPKYMSMDMDLLCDSSQYREHCLHRLDVRLQQRSSSNVTDDVIHQLIILGETDRATQILLETDPSDADYYSNFLKACVLTAGPDRGEGSGVSKLVATSLVASGQVRRGVELLCASGQVADACRYLQTAGQWENALTLARCRLSAGEQSQILTKHAERLLATGQEGIATQYLLAAGRFSRVADMVRLRDPYLYRTLADAAARPT